MIEIPEFKFALREDLKDKPEFLPARAEELATGWDVRCAEPDGVKFFPFTHVKMRLGFRMFAPPGWWLELRPRSSTHAKKNLHALYGVIDNTFENELLFSSQYIPPTIWKPVYNFNYFPKPPEDAVPDYWCLGNDGFFVDDHHGLANFKAHHEDPLLEVKFGERIGQVRPVRLESMNVVSVSNEEYDRLCKERNASRGTGGFGSTGE